MRGAALRRALDRADSLFTRTQQGEPVAAVAQIVEQIGEGALGRVRCRDRHEQCSAQRAVHRCIERRTRGGDRFMQRVTAGLTIGQAAQRAHALEDTLPRAARLDRIEQIALNRLSRHTNRSLYSRTTAYGIRAAIGSEATTASATEKG